MEDGKLPAYPFGRNRTKLDTYECIYKYFSDTEGKHQVKDSYTMNFIVDTSTKKAYMLGSIGTSEVILIPNNSGLTFVEISNTGNVFVTAITDEGN